MERIALARCRRPELSEKGKGIFLVTLATKWEGKGDFPGNTCYKDTTSIVQFAPVGIPSSAKYRKMPTPWTMHPVKVIEEPVWDDHVILIWNSRVIMILVPFFCKKENALNCRLSTVDGFVAYLLRCPWEWPTRQSDLPFVITVQD